MLCVSILIIKVRHLTLVDRKTHVMKAAVATECQILFKLKFSRNKEKDATHQNPPFRLGVSISGPIVTGVHLVSF